eukprot:g3727.t1
MVVKAEHRKSTPQQLMAKALADLYARLSPTDVVRFNQLLSGISHNPGKLSAADQAMLSQVIRNLTKIWMEATGMGKKNTSSTLEQSVMADAHNMMPDLDTTSDSTRSPCDNADHEHSEDDFGGSSVGTLPPVEEEPGPPRKKLSPICTCSHGGLVVAVKGRRGRKKGYARVVSALREEEPFGEVGVGPMSDTRV